MAWRSALPHMPGLWRLALPDHVRPTGHAPLDLASLKYRDVMIQDIKRFCEARHLPTTVVYIPDRAELLGGDRESQAFAEARDFAGTLGAIFLDGREIFEGMSRAEIRAHYLPYNGHWNQVGSNRFAEFVVRRLCLPEGQPDGTEGGMDSKKGPKSVYDRNRGTEIAVGLKSVSVHACSADYLRDSLCQAK